MAYKCVDLTSNRLCLEVQSFALLLNKTSVSETIRKPPLVKDETALKTKKNKIWRKWFSIWQMEFLNPAMLHDHDIYFARWLHPAMWHVALESWQWIHQVAAPCNVRRGFGMTCYSIRPVAAPCNVPGGSGMTCHRIRPNVRHIGILHLVSISTTSLQSTCHSAPVSEILSKSDHPRQKKITSCRFSRCRISAILDFRDPIMGSLKSPII